MNFALEVYFVKCFVRNNAIFAEIVAKTHKIRPNFKHALRSFQPFRVRDSLLITEGRSLGIRATLPAT